jgi:leucine efflux protein
MLGVTDLSTYVVGTIAIVLLPGPNSLYVLSTAARYGVRTGYRAAAGVFLGDWVLMIAAAAGVASLLRAYPPIFIVVKYAGAAYLAYVGVTMALGALRRWRRGNAAPAARRGDAAPAAIGALAETRSLAEAGAPAVTGAPGGTAVARRPFRRAFVISILNPKAILFVISFFIQFIDPSYSYPALSFLLLAVILQVCSVLYLSVLIAGGTYLAAQFRHRRRLASALTAGVGALFVGFGIRLATAPFR